MGMVTKIVFLSPFPLLDYRSSGGESQAFNPEKKGDFFYLHQKNIYYF
jgi:hypothetical protein